MEPLTIAAAAAIGYALYRNWKGEAAAKASAAAGLPIVIPPASPYPPAPANLGPPDGTKPIGPPYPADLSPWGYKQLHYAFGTIVIDLVDGQLIVGRIENHYHGPTETGVTAHGWHKGLTAYVPTKDWLQVGGDPPAAST